MKPVLITGAGSGIGLATARRFAAEGHPIAAVDLHFSAEAASVVKQSGGMCIERDVTSMEGARSAIDSVGSLAAVVTCAGISRDASLSKMTQEDWDTVIGVDLEGTFNYIAAAVPAFRREQSGAVVAVASTLALRSRRGVANYVAAKSGVVGMVRAFSCDLRPFNVTVNAVAPGLVETSLAEKIPADVKTRLLEETCLGRFASPDDVAHVIYFLCTRRARSITGQVIRIDGGQLA